MLVTNLSEHKFIKANVDKLTELIPEWESTQQVAVILLLSIGWFCRWFPDFVGVLVESLTANNREVL